MPYFGIPIRNGLPIGLGSVAGFGIAPFEPYSLFENGEQGAWYDPSDFSTLFTDSAGTTPVTAVEQFVGLMLDKSKGLVLGPELVTNGDFSNGSTGWTVISGAWTVANGRLNAGNTDAIKRYAQSASNIVAGRWYKATWNQYAGAGTGAANWTIPGIWNGSDNLLNGGNYINGAGEKTIYFVAPVSGQFYIYNFEQEVEYDNFTVRELPGNHATQTTSAKRPKLAARYNLLTYTEQFDNAAWGKTNITAVNTTATTDPLGGTTAEKIASTTGTWPTYIIQTVTPGVQVFSVYAKQAECRYLLMAGITFGEFSCYFDLQNGTSTGTAGFTRTMTAVGNGWYRCTVSGTFTSINIGFQPNLSGSGLTPGATGDGVYLWGADLRPASQATGLIGPTYQRVVDAATYDTVGFLPYLQFDGLSWSMSTGSIDFTATDKMTVWAGVRKIGTAASCVAELSNDVATLNGNFSLFAPGGNAPVATKFFWASKGTSREIVEPSGYAEPYTAVLAGIGNISGDSAILRVNGAQAASGTGDQGTGNYDNHPLYLGGRAGTSLYFNGWLTSLIVRGAQSTQSQIEATESWVNGKTGAY